MEDDDSPLSGFATEPQGSECRSLETPRLEASRLVEFAGVTIDGTSASVDIEAPRRAADGYVEARLGAVAWIGVDGETITPRISGETVAFVESFELLEVGRSCSLLLRRVDDARVACDLHLGEIRRITVRWP